MAAQESGVFLHISVNATRENREGWGDTQYAEGLAEAIRRNPGCDARVFFRGETPELTGGRDVVLRIVGPHLEEPVPGLPNMLWIISPPNFAPMGMMGRYQAVFSGSRHLVSQLQLGSTLVAFLPQATAAGHFHPDKRPAGAEEIPVVFVGAHAARAERRLVLDAVGAGFDVRIWGPGWGGVVPDRIWQGERLGYDALAEVYASARVILNSHMPLMQSLGFMSNRSFDAIASGACVVSDAITGFSAPELPELFQVGSRSGLITTLSGILARPPLDRAGRLDLHGRLVANYDFERRATQLIATAKGLLAEGRVAAPAFRPAITSASTSQPPQQVRLVDPAQSESAQDLAMLTAARQIVALAAALERPEGIQCLPPAPAEVEGVIHPLMADLRDMQRLASQPLTPEAVQRIDDLAGRARRLLEVIAGNPSPFVLRLQQKERDARLTRVIENEPLWEHRPQDYQRETRKTHVKLRPRREPTASDTPVGVFLHLYYEDLAAVFAERLAVIDAACRVYVSTDTEAKAAHIRKSLPHAEIRVFQNRGRDIWPKLYGFADVYDRHEIVLHLHGKKSLHAERLDLWLQHILDCLLGSREDASRILSMFRAIPDLGLVTPVAFRDVMGAAHWGANRDIARELAFRMALKGELPNNNQLQFPVGSMFWGRVSAFRPLLDLKLRPEHFPPEAGQVDGTLAHAIERMLGVVCTAQKFSILAVSGSGQSLHPRYRKEYGNNGKLRDAIAAGEFDA